LRHLLADQLNFNWITTFRIPWHSAKRTAAPPWVQCQWFAVRCSLVASGLMMHDRGERKQKAEATALDWDWTIASARRWNNQSKKSQPTRIDEASREIISLWGERLYKSAPPHHPKGLSEWKWKSAGGTHTSYVIRMINPGSADIGHIGRLVYHIHIYGWVVQVASGWLMVGGWLTRLNQINFHCTRAPADSVSIIPAFVWWTRSSN